ncbi:glycosyltransferase family 2 protein [Mycoplasma sp. E35C]|uniref:glycosyltransferase family 2 protein n=1 Tax=Mycoplasma sp. E35C TaxID=2801918 RepID=UPI002102DECC|nr:glycosyltransferase [Mycoplasma sp. E35C]
MSKISIIYYLSQEIINLKTSLNSLFNINNLKDHELIFVNDDVNENVIKIWQTELSKYPDLDYQIVNVSQSLGMGEAFNLGIQLASGEYTLLTNQLVTFKPAILDDLNNVIKELNNEVDVINFLIDEPSFYDVKKEIADAKNNNLEIYETFNKSLILKSSLNFYDKLFKTKLLVDEKIKFNTTHYQPGIFVLKVYGKAKKCVLFKKVAAKRRKEISLGNNIYDILFQINQFDHLKKVNEWNDKYQAELEFAAVITTYYHFISLLLTSNFSDYNKRNAIKITHELLLRFYPKYEKNKYLQEISDPLWKDYFLKFKPKLSWIQTKFNDSK